MDYLLVLSRPTRPIRGAVNSGAIVAGANTSFTFTLAAVTPAGINLPDQPLPITFDCTGAPRGSRCTVDPLSADLSQGQITVHMTLETSAGTPHALRLGNSSRAIRTQRGSYLLRLNARMGSYVRSSTVDVTVR